jgi:hypothetical protein
VSLCIALGKETKFEFFLNFFAECPSAWHSAKRKKLKISLPSAPLQALGKEENFFFENFFAEYPYARHSAKKKDFFLKNSLPSAPLPALGKENFLFF